MGPGFCVAFLALAENVAARGRRRVGCAHPPAAGLCPAAGLFLGPGPKAPALKTPPPPACPPLPSCAHIQPPYGWRRRAGEGEGGDVGSRRGAAAFCGPRGPAKPKHGRGPKVPAHALCALCAPAAPPGTLRFSAVEAFYPPTFPASTSYKQNEPAAPDERRASIIRCKPRKVFQQVFPRFFQKRARGCGGRVAPHTTTLANCGRGAGSPPHGDATERKPS